MATIEIHGLSKRFGGVTAVDGLSFTAREGAVTGFLGPNGAGKSTTLRMLLGLVTPSDGSAAIDGHRYADHHKPFRRVGAMRRRHSPHHPQGLDVSGHTARIFPKTEALSLPNPNPNLNGNQP